MRVESIPVVGPLLAAGADDRVFDALLLLGPVAIVAIAVLGRTTVSEAIAIVYTGGFVVYVLSKGLSPERNT
ncbi:MAG: hypothetical protein ABEJ81_00255 [Haloferacaceae archaeon]